MATLLVYLVYLAVSLGVTVKVGSMLHKHGTVFLIHHLHGQEPLARSINNLLLVGFYLLNIGYILIVMNLQRFGISSPLDSFNIISCLDFLSTHLGVILFSLGAVHFTLLRVLVAWQPKMHKAVN
jgi:hypothetical protein